MTYHEPRKDLPPQVVRGASLRLWCLIFCHSNLLAPIVLYISLDTKMFRNRGPHYCLTIELFLHGYKTFPLLFMQAT